MHGRGVFDADTPCASRVREADQAVWIGESLPSQSYLRIDSIVAARRRAVRTPSTRATASWRRTRTSRRPAVDAGLVFIGPSAEAIRAMGTRRAPSGMMQAAGVPCVPGYQGEDQSEATLLAEAKRIGFPVMIKATAGGGGRGMRLVAMRRHFGTRCAARVRRRRARSAIRMVILERAIVQPRHIEIQVFADRHGNACTWASATVRCSAATRR
jgi:geranyl-CoA carboxylase alpha subunit